ncbi:hypothetical protein Tco_0385588 [Tanacetum coccineum]
MIGGNCPIQELELQQLRPDSPAEEAEAEPNIWDDESVDVNPFGGEKPRLRVEGKSKVETWLKMKKLMKAKFLPKNHHQEGLLDYHNLSQQNITVEEVINGVRYKASLVVDKEEHVVDTVFFEESP